MSKLMDIWTSNSEVQHLLTVHDKLMRRKHSLFRRFIIEYKLAKHGVIMNTHYPRYAAWFVEFILINRFCRR